MTKERVVSILISYISNDLEAADPAYVRETLTDICGCDTQELKELGLDWLWPDGGEEIV